MTISIFGVAVLLIGGFLLVRGSLLAMLAFVMITTLFGGSAAFIITAMGSVSVSPANVAIVFLVLRTFLLSRSSPPLREAWSANAFLALFALYGAFGAWILPRVFQGEIDVTPLRPLPSRNLMAVYPLGFSNQNITVSAYLLTTLLGSVCAYAAARAADSVKTIVRTAASMGIIHAALGVGSVVAAGTPMSTFFAFFRNGFYAQLNQSFGGMVRMNGIFAEPAIYAAYGFAWFVFLTECWLRNVEKKWTRAGSLLLLAALLISTSSTAYIGLSAYLALLTLRQLSGGKLLSGGKVIALAAATATLIAALLIVAVAKPDLIEEAGRIVSLTTVDKLDTESGLQRTFWAKQGVDAFIASAGLGIGAGSFRSSSLVTAILGSMGLIGITAFMLHLLRVFGPLRASTYGSGRDERQSAGVAAAWAALVMLIPVSLTAPSPDPGLVWGLLGGLALAMREPAARPKARLSGQRHAGVTKRA